MKRLEERKRVFQSIDIQELQRKREESSVELRKKKRLSSFSKKRALHSAPHFGNSNLFENLLPEHFLGLYPELFAPNLDENSKLEVLLNYISSSYEISDLILVLNRVLKNFPNSAFAQVYNSGVPKRLLNSLGSNPQLDRNIVSCLVNLACAPQEYLQGLIEAQVVELIAKVFFSTECQVLKELCVWAHANLAGTDTNCRNKVIATGVWHACLRCLNQNTSLEFLSTVVWMISNLCRGTPCPPRNLCREVLGMIPKFLRVNNAEVVKDTCWILNFLTDSSEELISEVLKTNCSKDILDLIANSNRDVQVPALRTVGNILAGSDFHTQTLLNLGVIEKLVPLLASPVRAIKKEALWGISNILAGNQQQVSQVIQHPCMQCVVECLQEPDLQLRKEAIWCVANSTRFLKAHLVVKLVEMGALEQLVESLEFPDSKVLMTVLKAVENILTAGNDALAPKKSFKVNDFAVKFHQIGGLNKLEKLQMHPNKLVYKMSVKIIGKFYGFEHKNDENIENKNVPQVFDFY